MVNYRRTTKKRIVRKDPNVDLYRYGGYLYKFRNYIKMDRKYDNPRMMQNLEKAFKDSKIWRWYSDETDKESWGVAGKPNMTKSMNRVNQTIKMWNEEIYEEGWKKVNPTAHDKKVFATLINRTFLNMYNSGHNQQ